MQLQSLPPGIHAEWFCGLMALRQDKDLWVYECRKCHGLMVRRCKKPDFTARCSRCDDPPTGECFNCGKPREEGSGGSQFSPAALFGLNPIKRDYDVALCRKCYLRAQSSDEAFWNLWRKVLLEMAGEHLRVTSPTRNAPCPCGSGKKHKRCCHGRLSRN